MDIENLAKELILKNMTPEQQMAVLESVRQSVANAKEVQKKKIGENVDLVVQALKKIESDIRDRFDAVGNSIEKRVLSIQDGRDGANGTDGRNGKDGKSGRDGLKGDRGVDGQAGRDGVDGVDGISVVNAQIDFDGSLVITLSDGRELNVGEVVSADVAEKIKVISTMSTNAAIGIKDEGSSITSSVKTINFVGATVTATNSGDDVTVNVSAGTGTVTSVGVSGGTTGLTTTGSPITTTGTITLGGTLAVASGGTGTATPSLVAGTNITSITGTWPNQTINASGGAGTVTSVAATGGTGISITGSPITTSGTLTITNTAPDQTVALTQSGTTTITGTYPNFTISSADQFQGTVTSVAATVPAFLSITGSPVTTTGTLAIGLSGTALPVLNGGTGVTTSTGTTNVVLSNSPTLVTPALGTPSALVGTNITGTATSFNINGTVGATTPASGAFTTLSATGVTTVQAGTAALPAITTTGDTNTGIFFPAADTIAFSEGGAEAMRIDSSGNVGIGTASPSARLHVDSGGTADGFRLNSTTTSVFNSWYLSSVRKAYFLIDSSGILIDSEAASTSQRFATQGSERMRIDSSGNLLLGTTTNPGGSARLGIKGSGTTISTVSLYIINSSSVGNFLVYDDGSINTGTTSAGSPYVNTTGNAANAVLGSDGFLRRSTSSLKYKTDIQDATHGLTDLLKLRSVTYKGKNDGDIIFGGLIAEEVDAAGLNEFVQYAADGSPDALNYGNMVSLCVKAIQEQQALITALTARITALENK